MRSRHRAWALIVLAAITAAALAALRGAGSVALPGAPLRVGYAIEAPYAYVDAQGRVQGESAGLLRLALARRGEPEPLWIHLPFAELIDALERGRIDVIACGLFITPDRARRVAYTRPTAAVRTALLVPAGNPRQFQALGDFTGRHAMRLAVIDGAVEARQARARGVAAARLLTVRDAREGIEAVRSGRAAAFALSAPSLRHEALRRPGLFTVVEPDDLRGEAELGLPAYAWRPQDARRGPFDAALGEVLGSPAHRELARGLGYTDAEIDLARQFTPAGRP